MNNIQLWVEHLGTRQLLDLYEEDTPKINLSSEDLEDLAAVTGSFTNTFRLPASSTNTKFFKYFYNYNVSDFDLTKSIEAEIVIAGNIKFIGQLRLQAAYRNNQDDLIEFEVLFIGEIRDFAGEIGEINLNEIGGDLFHPLTMANIVTSWDADPANTNGLFDGNVVYPLCEWGYEYNDDNETNFNQIASSNTPTGNPTDIFTNSARPLVKEQFRPFIRAKWIVDQLFSLTEFTFDSSFLDSELFKSVYVNAGGNQARGGLQFQVPSANFLANREPFLNIQSLLNEDVTAPYTVTVDDESNLWSGTQYTAPVDGSYSLEWIQSIILTWNTSGTNCGSPVVTVEAWYKINGTKIVLGTGTSIPGQPNFLFQISQGVNLTLTAGDVVEVGYTVINVASSTCTYVFNAEFLGGFVTIENAPLAINPPLLLKNDVKAIDWLKSLFTKFRLVLQPKSDNPKEFIIEPIGDFLGTGERRDWTHKLDGNKDVKIEPIFYTQDDRLEFTDQEGEDFVNESFQQRFGEVFGTRKLNSGNDLLKGTRVIETLFTPTPLQRIFGTVTNDMVIPFFTDRTTTDALKFEPIVANPALVFWNGLKPAGLTWHYRDDANNSVSNTTYPLVSTYSEFPTTSDTTHITWRIENPLFTPGVNTLTDFNLVNGIDVFQKYWKDYIESLYDIESRIMQAYFVLDTEDLGVQWNDLIFIKDSWWRPIEISNADMQGRESSLVRLIKVKSQDLELCDCRSWAISDLRFDTSTAFQFTYLDCNGDQQSDQVQGNSIIVCSCTIPDINLRDIRVTLAGTCVPQPSPVGDVNTTTVVDNEAPISITLNLQEATSEDVINDNWTTVRNIVVNPGEGPQFEDELNSTEFVRVRFDAIDPGATANATVSYTFNGDLRQSITVALSDEQPVSAILSTPLEPGELKIDVSISE